MNVLQREAQFLGATDEAQPCDLRDRRSDDIRRAVGLRARADRSSRSSAPCRCSRPRAWRGCRCRSFPSSSLHAAHPEVWTILQSQAPAPRFWQTSCPGRSCLAQIQEPAALARFTRPRHLRRTVLRPGVRVRGHAAVAHAGRAPDAARRAADIVPAAGGVVGVDVHLLVHQLGGPGSAVGAHADIRADAGGPAVVGVAAACLRRRGAAVRVRPMCSARSCAAPSCCGRTHGHDHAQLQQFPPHHQLAGGVGRVLDRGRIQRRARRASSCG